MTRVDELVRCVGCSRVFHGLTTIGGIGHALVCSNFRGFRLVAPREASNTRNSPDGLA